MENVTANLFLKDLEDAICLNKSMFVQYESEEFVSRTQYTAEDYQLYGDYLEIAYGNSYQLIDVSNIQYDCEDCSYTISYNNSALSICFI